MAIDRSELEKIERLVRSAIDNARQTEDSIRQATYGHDAEHHARRAMDQHDRMKSALQDAHTRLQRVLGSH